MPELAKADFLNLFPNTIIIGGRFKANKVSEKGDQKLCENIEEAERLNTFEGGKYDVFFTPNGDFKTLGCVKENGTGRIKKSVLDGGGNIYAIIGDIDFGDKKWDKPWEYFPELTPTIINKTKHGYHIFWLLKNPVSAKEYIKRREAVEEKLVSLMGIDKKAKDVTRFLRVPGFHYWSDNLPDDIDIETIQYNPSEKKTFDEIEKVVNVLYEQSCRDIIEKKELQKKYKRVKGMSGNFDEVFDKIAKDVDVRDVLENLYSRFQVRDNGSIYEGGKLTRGYKWNKVMNYVNNFSNDSKEQRPVGGPFSIAYTYFNRQLEDTLKYFRDKYDIKTSEILHGVSSTKEIKFEILKIQETTQTEYEIQEDGSRKFVRSYSLGRGATIDGNEKKTINELIESEPTVSKKEEQKGNKIFVDEITETQVIKVGKELKHIEVDLINKEIRYNNDGAVGTLIGMLITPIGKIENEKGGEQYIVKLERTDGYSCISSMPICGTVAKFREFLQKHGATYPEKCDAYFQFIYQYIYSTKEKYMYTNKMGYQEIGGEMLIVDRPDNYIDEERKIFIETKDFRSNKTNSIGSAIVVGESGEDIKNYVDTLIECYDGVVSYPAFLTVALGINVWYFRAMGIQIPMLFVFGLSQSGKTHFMTPFMHSMGIDKRVMSGSSAFVYEFLAKHYLPINMTEFRNDSVGQIKVVEGLIRALFDGTSMQKGRADQSTVTYESNCQYVFDGQSTFADDAVQTRLIMLLMKKQFQGNEDRYKDLPLMYKTCTEIFEDMEDFKAFIADSKERAKRIKNNIKLMRGSSRIIDNYSLLYALSNKLGLSEYNDYITQSLVNQDGYCVEDDIQTTYQKIFNMQRKRNFDFGLYKGGIIINVIEEDLPYKMNTSDIKTFIQTINLNFLSDGYKLGAFNMYVDFKYVFQTPALYTSFIALLSDGTSSVRLRPKTEEEITTIKSLIVFLEENDPFNDLIPELKANLGETQKQRTSGDLKNEIVDGLSGGTIDFTI